MKPVVAIVASFVFTLVAGVMFFAPGMLEVVGFKNPLSDDIRVNQNLNEPKTAPIPSCFPVFTFGFGTGEQQIEDLAYMIEATDIQLYGLSIRTFVQSIVGHMDESRRAGGIIYFEPGHEKFSELVFVPVKELNRFEELLDTYGEVEEGSPGTFRFDDSETEYYYIERGDYVFFSRQLDAFVHTGVSPEYWLSKLPVGYNAAMQLDTDRLPNSLRIKMFSALRQLANGWAFDNSSRPKKSEVKQFNTLLTAMFKSINQVKKMVVGVDIDPDSEKVRVDLDMKGTPSSKMASYGAAGMKMRQSRFAAFRCDGVLMNLNGCSPLLSDEAYDFEMLAELMLQTFDGQDDIGKLFLEGGRALKRTIDKGRIDGSVVVDSRNGDGNAVSVLHIERTSKIAKVLNRLVAAGGVAKSGFASSTITQSSNNLAGSHRGINFYQPVAIGDLKRFTQLEYKFIIGAAQNEIFVGFGTDPMTLMKKCIDSCDNPVTDVPDFSADFSVSRFANRYQSDEVYDIFKSIKGNDRISMTSNYTRLGNVCQFEMDMGVLKATFQRAIHEMELGK